MVTIVTISKTLREYAEIQLLSQISPNQNLQQLIPVNFADQSTGVVVVGDIGGIFGQDVTHNLVDGVITFFFQCLVYRGEDLMDLGIALLH